ncbi:MAG: integrin alpha [Candidatus Midichloria sp.]|nr:integrin alpha [Candidatus Midichloria sp.]
MIFGKPSFISPIEVLALNNSDIIHGITDYDYAGTSIASVGDLNNDGFRDIIIDASGAYIGNKAQAGQAYVVYAELLAEQVCTHDQYNNFKYNGFKHHSYFNNN